MSNTYSIKAIIRAVDKFSPGLMRMAANMDSFGRSAKNVGRGMTTNLTAPIVAFGGFTLKTAVGFESAMNRVEALSGETGDSLRSMRDMAQDLGATTSFSASEAAGAMGFLAQAGWKSNKILAATPGLLNLAAASGTELGRSADIATNIMGQFGIAARDSGRVADLLAATTASANVDMEMMAQSLKSAGPIAKTYGLTLGDTAAAIGLLGNVGIQGEVAGTALKNTMLGLVNPTGEAGKMLKHLGVQTRDAQGNMRPLADTLADFGEALTAANVGSGQQLQAIQALFGKEGLAGAAELLSQAQSGALRKYAEFLKHVEGRAESMANTMMKGAPGAVKNLASAFEGLQLAIAGSGLLEGFTDMAKAATGLVRTMSQANPELLRTATVVAGVVAVTGPAVWAIGGMVTAMGSLVKAAAFLKFGILAVGGALNVMKVAALANPITAMALAAAGAAVLIYQNWDGIVSWFTDKFDAVRAAFDEGIIQGLVKLWQAFNPVTVILESVNGLVNALTGIDIGAILMSQFQDAASMLPDWTRELLGVGDITASAPATAGGGSSPPADRNAMARINRANVPRGRDAKAQVDVNFSNLPQGARVESKSEGDGMDLGVGRGYALQRPM